MSKKAVSQGGRLWMGTSWPPGLTLPLTVGMSSSSSSSSSSVVLGGGARRTMGEAAALERERERSGRVERAAGGLCRLQAPASGLFFIFFYFFSSAGF